MFLSSIILVIILIGLILTLPCTFGLKGNELDLLHSFMTNGITEIAGILVTLGVVDYLLKKQEEKRVTPIKKVALQEVDRFVRKLLKLLIEMNKASTNKELPKNIDDLLSQSSFKEICNHLNMDAKAPASLPIFWRYYITGEVKEIKDMANSILNSYYIIFLPGKTVELIINIRDSVFFLMGGLLITIDNINSHYNNAVYNTYGPRFAPGLESIMTQQFDSLNQLITILESEKIYYIFSGIPELADNVAPKIGDSRIE